MKTRYENALSRVIGSCATLSISLATGCASMTPGMQFYNSSPSAGSEETTSQQTDAPPIKLITLHLLIAEKHKRDSASVSDIKKLFTQPSPYTIEPGDLLSIMVWDHPELTSLGVAAPSLSGGLDAKPAAAPVNFPVDHQGTIQFPYVGGLKVAGLTEEAARNLLTAKLQYYLNKPNVTLSIGSYRSKRVYIDGEIKAPGVQVINDIQMTLVEAVNRAGGFLPSADQSQISLNRNGSTFSINLPQLVQRGINPADIILLSGDVIRVRSRDETKVFVSGEVVTPRALPMHNGRLSLNEALGESGGINPLSGDSRQVYVVRRNGMDQPAVYRLDAYAPGALALAEGFELEPKDVVYVSATPLTNWHRTVSQLLPGALSSAVGTIAPGTR
jgi:polysaccharide export outer membrane protein